MSKPTTHRMIHGTQPIPNTADRQPKAELYRMPDGIRIATVLSNIAQYCENPQNIRMVVLIDHEHAINYLRKIADQDWAVTNGEDPDAKDFKERLKQYAANIDETDETRRIIPPGENRVLAMKN